MWCIGLRAAVNQYGDPSAIPKLASGDPVSFSICVL